MGDDNGACNVISYCNGRDGILSVITGTTLTELSRDVARRLTPGSGERLKHQQDHTSQEEQPAGYQQRVLYLEGLKLR